MKDVWQDFGGRISRSCATRLDRNYDRNSDRNHDEKYDEKCDKNVVESCGEISHWKTNSFAQFLSNFLLNPVGVLLAVLVMVLVQVPVHVLLILLPTVRIQAPINVLWLVPTAVPAHF